MADSLIERLREKCGTINFGGQQYAIFPPATDPLRLEAATELERLSAEVARLIAEASDYEADMLRIHNDKVDHFEARIAAEQALAKETAEVARLEGEVKQLARDSDHLLSDERRKAERTLFAKLAAESLEISQAIGTNMYMDPPDGGTVSLAEQVRRIVAENQSLRAQCGIRQIAGYRKGVDEMRAENERLSAELEVARRDGERYRASLVKAATDRFLAWKLPTGFCPDCGISFDGRSPDARGHAKTWPVGTNLFTADQAREMFEHCLAPIDAAREG